MGTPAVGLVTEQFRGLAEATARGLRVDNQPLIVLPSGYDEWSEDDIRADIASRLDDIVDALVA
ncbi:MAG: hypothetical protein OXT07_04725 [bacterium]|nr:hypothetical protein [bacterium]MXW59178.1 hypothetical protein [Acidimicrobiia bacterium]MDE0215566.1 hypothetical protein [bacterium]MDE0579293.1 hypothetical protein [bacterium]MDE0615316.1 hypothetical protein [bacterium]